MGIVRFINYFFLFGVKVFLGFRIFSDKIRVFLGKFGRLVNLDSLILRVGKIEFILDRESKGYSIKK